VITAAHAERLATVPADRQPEAFEQCFYTLLRTDDNNHDRNNLAPMHRLDEWLRTRVALDIHNEDTSRFLPDLADAVTEKEQAGANVLAMQSNDATFERDGQIGESGQQLAMARIRAVEFDRAVVVASTTGYSAIIAPDGHLITSSGTWQQAELEARVPLLTGTTLASRLGAWPEWAIVAATALAFGLAAGRAGASQRRPRSTDRPAGPAEGPASTAEGQAGTAEGL